MKIIKLTQEQSAIVDDEDYNYLCKFKWFADRRPKSKLFYACTNAYVEGKRTKVRMHRVIMNLSNQLQVDHINHNTLDNRKINLRIVTSRQNCSNLLKQSKYGVGVYRDKRAKAAKNPFEAHAIINSRRRCIGYFISPEAAKIARYNYLHAVNFVELLTGSKV